MNANMKNQEQLDLVHAKIVATKNQAERADFIRLMQRMLDDASRTLSDADLGGATSGVVGTNVRLDDFRRDAKEGEDRMAVELR
jgi:hypothetical protein